MAGRVGPRGLAVLIIAGLAGASLAVVGWSQRDTGLVASGAGGLGGSAPARPAPASSPRASGPAARAGATSSATPSASGSAGPLLSSEPYAQFAYLVWPGNPSTAARQAMSGLSISVSRQAGGISVRAGVTGQPPPSAQFFANGARVYVIESSLGDDSAGVDYNLGDDGLVVTDGQGRIVP
jgi:hypothetical protein